MNTTTNDNFNNELAESTDQILQPVNAKPAVLTKQSSKLGSREAIKQTNLSRNNSQLKNPEVNAKVEETSGDLKESNFKSIKKEQDAAQRPIESHGSKTDVQGGKKVVALKTDVNEQPNSKRKVQGSENTHQQVKKTKKVEAIKDTTKDEETDRRSKGQLEVKEDKDQTDPKIKALRTSRAYSGRLTHRSASKGNNGMTQSQLLIQREYRYLQEFDELNYLEQKLMIIEADKLRCKQKWKDLEHEAEGLRANINALKFNKELDKLSKPNYITADNINMIRTINAEKRKREESVKRRLEKEKEAHMVTVKELEERERQQREQLLIDKRNKMKENIENIRKRGESRKQEVKTTNRLVKDLLKTSMTVGQNMESTPNLRVSNLYKF